MRFITLIGLTFIASAINHDTVAEHASFLAILATVGLIVDIIDCHKKWNK